MSTPRYERGIKCSEQKARYKLTASVPLNCTDWTIFTIIDQWPKYSFSDTPFICVTCESVNQFTSCWQRKTLNVTFSKRSVLLVEQTRVPGESHRPVASHWQTLSHTVVWVHLAMNGVRTQVYWNRCYINMFCMNEG
jgi:hypothetical protein